MTAELISVGTEILMGNILNSNARYLAEKCASLGPVSYTHLVRQALYLLYHPLFKRALPQCAYGAAVS